MPFTVTQFEPTPNPNALKCMLDKLVVAPGEAPRSFRDAQAASTDPIAGPLFAIEPAGSVTSVLMNANWITVNKSSDADWNRVKRAVERVLAQAE